jgi:uncharacterized protein (DUF3820 family)
MGEPEANIIPFGKYRGRLVAEVLVDDPAYLQWLSGQEWFRAKFTLLHQVIINRGAEPEETPDHNAMQVQFLDDDFCLRFIRCYRPEVDEMARKALQAALNADKDATRREIADAKRDLEGHRRQLEQHAEFAAGRNSYRPWDTAETLRARIEKITDKISDLQAYLAVLAGAEVESEMIKFQFKRDFEACGVDAALTVTAECPYYDLAVTLDVAHRHYRNSYRSVLPVEIKPTVSDDYPAVLRQMKRNESAVLFVGEYTGKGATSEQFVKTFATADIRVVFARDVGAAGEMS